MQKNLQYCYNVILPLKLNCSTIVRKKKKNLIFYSTFPEIFLLSLSLFLFSSLSSFSVSHLLSRLFKLKHHHPPNINITHHSSRFWSSLFFFFFSSSSCSDAVILAGGGLINDGGNVDLAVTVFGFWSRLILFFFFLIWVFVSVGFWWAVVAWWVWRRRGGGDWAVEARC